MIIDRREQNKVLKPIDQNYTKKIVEQTSHLSYFIKNTLVSSTKKVTTECEMMLVVDLHTHKANTVHAITSFISTLYMDTVLLGLKSG